MSPVERSRNPDIPHIRRELAAIRETVLTIGKDARVETREALAHALRHAAEEVEGTAGERRHGTYEHVKDHKIREDLVELEKELVTLAAELGLEVSKLRKAVRNTMRDAAAKIASNLHFDAAEINLPKKEKKT